MHKGNWTCSDCGNAITELPFEPDPARTGNLKCRDCHRKGAPPQRNGGRNTFRERETVKGNWTCSDCGNAITELPFKPREGAGNIMCRDCFRASKA